MKKQGVVDPKKAQKATVRTSLTKLTLQQLKVLAQKHDLKVKGTVVEDWLNVRVKAPTKSQYVAKLSSVITEKEIDSILKVEVTPKLEKKTLK